MYKRKRPKFHALYMSTALVLAAPALAQELPEYYPADYQQLIEASRQEDGLLIQSNVSEPNWRPILDAFHEKYPWIEVQTLDLGGTEVFERFFAEAAADSSRADILLAAAGALWNDVIEDGFAVDYESAEAAHLPEWSRPAPGVYTVSVDPYVIVYNKMELTEDQYPHSLADLAALVENNPGQFDHRIATIEPFSSAPNNAYLTQYYNHVGLETVLPYYEVLGPVADLQRSGGPIFERIMTGEYVAAWSVSAVQMVPLIRDPARGSILGYSLPEDGLIMSTRLFAITTEAQSPNSARLFADFLLSEDGQVAVNAGGLLPYRPGLDLPDDAYGISYEDVVAEIGEENIIRTDLDPSTVNPPAEYVEQVNAAFGK